MMNRITNLTILVTFLAIHSSVASQLKVAGGFLAKQGEIPYQLMIQSQEYPTIFYGGALVEVNGIQAVVTSAAKTNYEYMDRIIVTAGKLKRNETSVFEQIRTSTWKASMKDGRRMTVAVYGMDKPFELNSNVQPVPLPEQGQRTVGSVYLSGWGGNNNDFEEFSNDLEWTITQVENDDGLCEDAFDSAIICTVEHEGKGSCYGDNGGPLVAAHSGNYLAGIIDSGGCGTSMTGYNINVAKYVTWIENVILENSKTATKETDKIK